MKRANAVLDLKNDKAVLFGNEKKNSSKHPLVITVYCVTFKNACSNHGADEVLISEEAQTSRETFHKQFGHSNSEKFKFLLKDAGNSDPELSNMVDGICKKCEVCLKFKKPDSKPAVAYQLSKRF